MSPPRTFFCALVCQTVIPEGCPTLPSPASVREVCGLQPSIEILQIYTYLNDVIINYARDLCLLEYSDLTALCIHFNKDFKHNSLLYVCVWPPVSTASKLRRDWFWQHLCHSFYFGDF